MPNDEVDEACSLRQRVLYLRCQSTCEDGRQGHQYARTSSPAICYGDILKVQGADSEYVMCVDRQTKIC